MARRGEAFYCDICEQPYPTSNEAEKCEGKGFKPRFRVGSVVHLGEGSDYAHTDYRVETRYVERATHHPIYQIRETISADQRKAFLKLKNIGENIRNPQDDSMVEYIDQAKFMNEEEWISQFRKPRKVPEEVISCVTEEHEKHVIADGV